MNDIERINKVVNGLIDVICCSSVVTSNIHNSQKLTDLKNLINQPIDPTQPEGYQGLNKWYVYQDEQEKTIFYALSKSGQICGYGLNGYYGEWKNDIGVLADRKIRPTTESEIKEAILKGCEQNGIVEGATIKLSDGTNHDLIKIVGWQFDQSTNIMWVSTKLGRLLKVFDNGKFAKVVKEEKITDKELLNECADLFNLHVNGNQLIMKRADELLTKLNKHLNHD